MQGHVQAGVLTGGSLKTFLEFKGTSDKEYRMTEYRLQTEKKHRVLIEG
jgi:hypothetical protein